MKRLITYIALSILFITFCSVGFAQDASPTPNGWGWFDPGWFDESKVIDTGTLYSKVMGWFEQLQNFDPEATFGFSPEHVHNFDPDRFKNMPSLNIAQMFANFDLTKIDTIDVQQLLPPGWSMDENGILKPPSGAKLAFPFFVPKSLNNVKLPDIPDFSKGFGLEGTGADLITRLNDVLAALGVEDQFTFKQNSEDGIIHVEGIGVYTGSLFAFLPDVKNMVQAQEGAHVGLTQNESGHYVFITLNGIQIPFIPAPFDFSKLVNAIPGVSVEMGSMSETMLNVPGRGSLVGIFKENVILDSQGRAPGLYCAGTPFVDEICELVFEDGTMQQMHPAIQAQTQFKELIKSIAGVEELRIGKDGIINLIFSGTAFSLKPAFAITQSQAGTTGKPSLSFKDAETLIFDDGNGNLQECIIQKALAP